MSKSDHCTFETTKYKCDLLQGDLWEDWKAFLVDVFNLRLLNWDTEQANTEVDKTADDTCELWLLEQGRDEHDLSKDGLCIHEEEAEHQSGIRILNHVNVQNAPSKKNKDCGNGGVV